MITEDYVTFETAKLLKEKGFDVYVHSFYDADDMPAQHNEALWDWNLNKENYRFSAPTIQMAMKWLREVHNLHCDIGYDFRLGWNNKITSLKETIIDHDIEMKTYLPYKTINYPSYEDACEDAIKYCLKELI